MLETLSGYSLFAVFVTGLLGGVHCAGMCGGIVSALGMMNQRPSSQAVRVPIKPGTVALTSHPSMLATKPVGTLSAVGLYNLGRLFTYVTIGAIAGGVGSTAWLMQTVLPIQKTAFFLSSVLLVVIGLYIAGWKRLGLVIESLGLKLWLRIKPYATAKLKRSGYWNMFTAGIVWGLVPCGMVYAVLSVALVSGSAAKGALVMLAFGLGTLPNLILLGMSGQWLAKMSKQPLVRIFAGVMIIGFGVLGLMHSVTISV